MAIVNALLTEQPKLESEERLASIYDGSVASGAVKKSSASQHIRALKRAQRTKPKPATIDDLRGLGFEVVNG